MDIVVDLDALGLGQPLPVVATDDEGSFGSALSPRHSTQGTLEGGGVMGVCLVVCSELQTHPKKM